MRIVLSIVLAALWACPAAMAGPHVFVVNEPVDGEPGSLRTVIEAINAHPDVDPESTFLVHFELVGGLVTVEDSLPVVDKPQVTVEGPGRADLVISGGDQHRLFYLSPNVQKFEISGLSLRDGNPGASAQAGCLNTDSESTVVVIREVDVDSCQGRRGGAIATQGPLYVHDSSFAGNTALGSLGAEGGAINAFSISAPVEIRRSTFSFNTAMADPSPLSSASGGALAISTLASALIEDSHFNSNGSTNVTSGGAIRFQGGTLVVRRSTLDSNAAFRGSAVMSVGSTSALRFENVTVAGNHAGGGGAVNIFQGSFWGRNNTFWNNAGDLGTDLQIGQLDSFNASHHVHARDPGIAGATAPTHCSFEELPASAWIHHSLALDESCQMDVVEDLGTAELGEFHGGVLLVVFDSGSPAVNGGAPHVDANGTDAMGCEPLDARRMRRPMDGNGQGQPRCDIGALEHGRFSWMFMSGFENYEQ